MVLLKKCKGFQDKNILLKTKRRDFGYLEVSSHQPILVK